MAYGAAAAPIPLDRTFAAELLKTFDDPDSHGVHVLFNQWWKHAPQSAIENYLTDFESLPDQKAFVAANHFAAPVSLEALAAAKEGTLGHGYYHFIVDNNLEKNLAMNYRAFHESLSAAGHLDRMPAPMRYAIIRGFQLHDLMHVLTGYESSGFGELALQAFCLAQIRFPYFGMWMSVTTTRMTFLHPEAITGTMDAISHGWSYGRAAKNIQFGRWEEQFERPLADIRAEYGLAMPPLPPRAS